MKLYWNATIFVYLLLQRKIVVEREGVNIQRAIWNAAKRLCIGPRRQSQEIFTATSVKDDPPIQLDSPRKYGNYEKEIQFEDSVLNKYPCFKRKITRQYVTSYNWNGFTKNDILECNGTLMKRGKRLANSHFDIKIKQQKVDNFGETEMYISAKFFRKETYISQ